MRRPRKPTKGYGLPPELAGMDHVGKQIARKRKEEAKSFLKAKQTALALEPASNAPAGNTHEKGVFSDISSKTPSTGQIKPIPLLPPQNRTPQAWFEAQGWHPFPFQQEVWSAMQAGESGLLHASTGSGKTYAVWLGAVTLLLGSDPNKSVTSPPALRVLWITPMRALAADTVKALQAPLAALGLDWQVQARTGDTEAKQKTAQSKQLPPALVTTPESLTLLLTRADARELFAHLTAVIVDEWHELMGNKRGVQLQLALARLCQWQPQAVVWGLSATLGNVPEAAATLMPGARTPRIVEGNVPKEVVIDTLIPATMERFPWGGHIGIKLAPQVVAEIEKHASTLVFTNTRSQAEIWYQELLTLKPDWAGSVALHHGSLDKEVREWVEAGLKQGSLKAVVSTSSLDLGVDFSPVERVMQIGSPKGIARLMQRAGRSGHAPGQVSRVTIVPTNALELIEAAAAREAAQLRNGKRRIEPRRAPVKPLDVLVQHLVTIALGGGFLPDDLYAEVMQAYSYRSLTREEFDWCLAFVESGGQSLTAYPDYQRIAPDEAGLYRVPKPPIAKRHRMSIGTIVSDTAMQVAWLSGGRLGTIEESFIARLRKGDCFTFAGRVLQLVRLEAMVAYVQKAPRGKGIVPQWQGGKMPLSSELADASLACLARMRDGVFDTPLGPAPELRAVQPLVELQMRRSALPTPDTLVIELMESREGHHLFCYPFAGRMVHIGLASLLAYRVARDEPGTFSISMNDYGFELLSPQPIKWLGELKTAFSTDNLLADVLASLNSSELAQRRFREIARIAGLVFQGFPGAPRAMRQVQASSGLFYEVFKKHDTGNLLLTQAEGEALEQELEIRRLTETLERIARMKRVIKRPERFTPFSFPLMVERLREKVSTESLSDRIARMVAELEAEG
jgi:ATP-dependent helicase Lhr and Lhr-like helicase